MRTAANRVLVAMSLTLAAVALAGCTNPDAPVGGREAGEAAQTSATPQSAGEPGAPAPPAPASQSPLHVQATPEAALTAFADMYIDWTYRTLTAQQHALAGISVGAARIAEQQAAATSPSDSTISQGHISNSGQVVSVAPDQVRRGMWIVVTRERTGGEGAYEGLPAGYHVTLAHLAEVRGGYAVTQWLPQS